MAQTAVNGVIDLPTDTWVLISEVACSFAFHGGAVHEYEILASTTGLPQRSDRGMPYVAGAGEDISVDIMSRFPGTGDGAKRLYAISRHHPGTIFVSRRATP